VLFSSLIFAPYSPFKFPSLFLNFRPVPRARRTCTAFLYLLRFFLTAGLFPLEGSSPVADFLLPFFLIYHSAVVGLDSFAWTFPTLKFCGPIYFQAPTPAPTISYPLNRLYIAESELRPPQFLKPDAGSQIPVYYPGKSFMLFSTFPSQDRMLQVCSFSFLRPSQFISPRFLELFPNNFPSSSAVPEQCARIPQLLDSLMMHPILFPLGMAAQLPLPF